MTNEEFEFILVDRIEKIKQMYEEYRRIGYRLRPKDAYKQTTIFDYLEEVK